MRTDIANRTKWNRRAANQDQQSNGFIFPSVKQVYEFCFELYSVLLRARKFFFGFSPWSSLKKHSFFYQFEFLPIWFFYQYKFSSIPQGSVTHLWSSFGKPVVLLSIFCEEQDLQTFVYFAGRWAYCLGVIATWLPIPKSNINWSHLHRKLLKWRCARANRHHHEWRWKRWARFPKHIGKQHLRENVWSTTTTTENILLV